MSICFLYVTIWKELYSNAKILYTKRMYLYCCLNCRPPTHLSFLWSFSLFNKKQLPLFKGYLKYSRLLPFCNILLHRESISLDQNCKLLFHFGKSLHTRCSVCCQNYTTFIIMQQYNSTQQTMAIAIFFCCKGG